MKQHYQTLAIRLLFLSFLILPGVSFCAESAAALACSNNMCLITRNQLGVTARDAESLFVTYDYTDKATGIQHIYSTQKLNGLTITNSQFSLTCHNGYQFDANRLLALKTSE